MNSHDPSSPAPHSFTSSIQDVSIEETGFLSPEIENETVTVTEEELPKEVLATPNKATPLPRPVPIPIPPIRLLRRVSGRYRSSGSGYQLELRVDVDGVRPTKCVSGDFFAVSGGTSTYFGSLILKSPVIIATSSTIVIRGTAKYTWSAAAPVIQVTIARRTIFQPAAPAKVQFYFTSGSPGAAYACNYVSAFFRSVAIELDRTSDVTTPVFSSYNTGSLPSGGTARMLSIASSYAEAGIEMVSTAGADVINIGEAGADAKWSNAELHASMQRHFSRWRDLPQFAVWQVACYQHEMGDGLYGIMFDQQGKQRQGCAVFYKGIGGTTPQKLRLQLYTHVHELGHCFNLLHSWQKSYATPPGTNRPDSLSWMNYPWYYTPSTPGAPGGEAAFWNGFNFQFDNLELAHLRHAFYNDIIMGGNPFATGAGLDNSNNVNLPQSNEPGLAMELACSPSLALGEPVVATMRLRSFDSSGKTVHPHLHPNLGIVQVFIKKPNGEVVTYEPFMEHCIIPQQVNLGAGDTLEESAYIGFGKGGHYFDQPGRYMIIAIYPTVDGLQVVSNTVSLWVKYPVTAAEEELARLFLGDEQGTLLYLLGSDSPSLQNGNDAFDEVIQKYPKHSMAHYARLVKGINASRQFKTIDADTATRFSVRAANYKECSELLSTVVESKVLDPVSTDMAMSYLADSLTGLGDEKSAKDTRRKTRGRAARDSSAILIRNKGN